MALSVRLAHWWKLTLPQARSWREDQLQWRLRSLAFRRF
jgi:hypothetical protein